MREILFRGKRIDNGEWVFGSLWLDNEEIKNCETASISWWSEEKTVWNREDVDISTVGQYTGLTDKNCEKIFEGDIVWGDDCTGTWHKGVVEYDDSIGSFIINSKRFMQYSKNENHYDLLGCWTVEGNIYDGHESLEGDTNG